MSLTMAALRKAFSQLVDFLSLAHLITESNIKAYVTPTVLCGMFAIASGGVTARALSWPDVAAAFPKVVAYIWLYDLYFDCSNQKDPGSIAEDRLNKPWRAIPSGRLSVAGAQRWFLCAAAVLPCAAGLWLRGLPEALLFMLETWAYDGLGGGATWWGRSLLNPLFFATGQLGAMRVAAGTATSLTRAAYEWCLLHGLMVLTTIHTQDLRDQEGDRLRGRRTLPLALGDGLTRGVMAFFICFWSLAIPAYWHCSLVGYLLPGLVGIAVSSRFLLYQDVKADRFSFHLYSLLWMPALYSTPMFGQ